MKTASVTALVASKNAVKHAAVHDAFETFGLRGITVSGPTRSIESGVRDQPLTLEEAMNGATNRLDAIRTDDSHDYYVAIESGVHRVEGHWFESTCIALAGADRDTAPHIAYTPSFPVPPMLAAHLEKDEDLNQAMKAETGIIEAGQKGGFDGWLTDGAIDRKAATSIAVRIALHSLHKERKG